MNYPPSHRLIAFFAHVSDSLSKSVLPVPYGENPKRGQQKRKRDARGSVLFTSPPSARPGTAVAACSRCTAVVSSLPSPSHRSRRRAAATSLPSGVWPSVPTAVAGPQGTRTRQALHWHSAARKGSARCVGLAPGFALALLRRCQVHLQTCSSGRPARPLCCTCRRRGAPFPSRGTVACTWRSC